MRSSDSLDRLDMTFEVAAARLSHHRTSSARMMLSSRRIPARG